MHWRQPFYTLNRYSITCNRATIGIVSFWLMPRPIGTSASLCVGRQTRSVKTLHRNGHSTHIPDRYPDSSQSKRHNFSRQYDIWLLCTMDGRAAKYIYIQWHIGAMRLMDGADSDGTFERNGHHLDLDWAQRTFVYATCLWFTD